MNDRPKHVYTIKHIADTILISQQARQRVVNGSVHVRITQFSSLRNNCSPANPELVYDFVQTVLCNILYYIRSTKYIARAYILLPYLKRIRFNCIITLNIFPPTAVERSKQTYLLYAYIITAAVRRSRFSLFVALRKKQTIRTISIMYRCSNQMFTCSTTCNLGVYTYSSPCTHMYYIDPKSFFFPPSPSPHTNLKWYKPAELIVSHAFLNGLARIRVPT